MGVLASGDATVAVPSVGRQDEIGAMASAVQVFKDNLIRTRQLEEETALARASAEEQRKAGMRQMADSFEQAVGGIVGMVSSSATELQATAQQMTSTASETASQSTSVAAAAEEAAANVNTVAAAAEELGSSVQEIGRQVAGSARSGPHGRGRGRPDRRARAGAERGRVADRRRGDADLHDCRPDQPPGPERHHRGGAGG